MAKSIARIRTSWTADANRFEFVGGEREPSCLWRGCREPQLEDLPMCLTHSLMISCRLQEILTGENPMTRDDIEQPTPTPWRPQPFVYYLMIGPTTVKIGTTGDLRQRLNALRTDAQYVVAIERGDMELERQRHKQFAETRLGRREDFRLSPNLDKHIRSLQSQRDELVQLATTYPLVNA